NTMYLSFSLYPFTISSQTTSLPVFSLIRLNLMLLRSLLSSISRSNLLESVAEYSLMGIFTRPKPTAPFQIALIVSFLNLYRNFLSIVFQNQYNHSYPQYDSRTPTVLFLP